MTSKRMQRLEKQDKKNKMQKIELNPMEFFSNEESQMIWSENRSKNDNYKVKWTPLSNYTLKINQIAEVFQCAI